MKIILRVMVVVGLIESSAIAHATDVSIPTNLAPTPPIPPRTFSPTPNV